MDLFLRNFLGIKDVPLSLLFIVGINGIKKILNIEFTEEEKKDLMISAKTIKEVIAFLNIEREKFLS